ncbi:MULTISPECIES: ADP-ribosylglycohydrolase family protein [unclassified Lentimonas]|uniref:ADP-ribosylglycohydrolase family protein n=1 Tax=unclassified Lentimonas TaxID=2630993 RepID=UPI00132B5888|nr:MULTISPECIES: ADP-ribosylglycohydrolase family protein [unclassified Lentimonas]CAA6692294.1 Unannotated [Lentimonas sp. CC19]CAA6696392.1 Unannotated [Lentimonas sp. CC10]CAA7069096.1 Unannotated [Lentimonas sp. CC11]
MNLSNQIRGCIYGGALGDAYGSAVEGQASAEHFTFESVDSPRITDDTQLTLATCEALSGNTGSIPDQIAASFADWYQHGKVTGMGSSTLKALRDLSMGAEWMISGARGEMSAGNGAAMRIAPLAFLKTHPDDFRFLIRDVSSITHKNDEAYVGALAVVIIIQDIRKGVGIKESLKALPDELPDTRVRDQICKANRLTDHSIEDAAQILGRLHPSLNDH